VVDTVGHRDARSPLTQDFRHRASLRSRRRLDPGKGPVQRPNRSDEMTPLQVHRAGSRDVRIEHHCHPARCDLSATASECSDQPFIRLPGTGAKTDRRTLFGAEPSRELAGIRHEGHQQEVARGRAVAL